MNVLDASPPDIERAGTPNAGPASLALRRELEELATYAHRLDVPLLAALDGLLEVRQHAAHADQRGNHQRTGIRAVRAWGDAARTRLYRTYLGRPERTR
jgi:hypothetical protein